MRVAVEPADIRFDVFGPERADVVQEFFGDASAVGTGGVRERCIVPAEADNEVDVHAFETSLSVASGAASAGGSEKQSFRLPNTSVRRRRVNIPGQRVRPSTATSS